MYLSNSKILYVPVPKCACSSVKNFCFQVENGVPFRNPAFDSDMKGIHKVFRTLSFEEHKQNWPEEAWSFAIVRHPVDRLVSCYEQKVLQSKVLDTVSDVELEENGLSRTPSLAEFVNNLDSYRRVNSIISSHSRRLRFFLGDDPSIYDRIYNISEIVQLTKDVNRKTGTNVKMPHRNEATLKVGSAEVSERLCAKIYEIYVSDFEIYGTYLGRSKYSVANIATA